MLICISPSRFAGKPMTLRALAATDYAVEIDGMTAPTETTLKLQRPLPDKLLGRTPEIM